MDTNVFVGISLTLIKYIFYAENLWFLLFLSSHLARGWQNEEKMGKNKQRNTLKFCVFLQFLLLFTTTL